MNEIGVVFGGGGSKGAYEAGVWRAVEELGFDVTAICGTSIGAINAAVIAQGDFDMLVGMWTDISLKDVVNESYTENKNLFNIKNIPHIAGEIYKNQKLDITPFEVLLNSLIDEDKIRKSKIDYGLSTFSVTDKQSLDMWKEDIPKGRMIDYIIASAAIFGIYSLSNDDRKFFDGCLKNNIPVNMMIEKGYTDIIAVDIGGFGVVKSNDISGINLFTVKCSENVIGFMDFESLKIERSIKMGYLDTFKTFGKLSGEKYYFETQNYMDFKMRYSQSIISGIEAAASAFCINQFYAYDINDLIRKIIHRYERYNTYYENLKGVFSQDSIINILTQKKIKLNDALIVTWLVDLIISKKREFISNKIIMNLLGNNYNAASAIVYILNT